jgi:hypothetical protein
MEDTTMRHRYILALLATLAACAPKPDVGSAAGPQEVTFVATDFAFAGPDSIAPGFTTIRLVNQGHQDHHLIFGKLADGKTLQDLVTFATEHPGAEPPFLAWHGAAGAVAPSGSTAGTVDLPAGKYVAICFMPDPTDGHDHASKGMVREVVVAGTRQVAQAPKAEGEIRLKDFNFEVPSIGAGAHTFHVINDGPQTHEVQLVRLNEGTTGQEYLAALAPGAKGPPPGVLLGGPGAYSKGGDGYWTVTFEPGKYMFVCFVPDPASGRPHMMQGMVHEFTVSTT